MLNNWNSSSFNLGLTVSQALKNCSDLIFLDNNKSISNELNSLSKTMCTDTPEVGELGGQIRRNRTIGVKVRSELVQKVGSCNLKY